MMCLNLLIYNPCRPDEHQVSVLQRFESAGEYILLQSQVKTSYWTNALQHPTMSRQVRPSALSHVSVVLTSMFPTSLVLQVFSYEPKQWTNYDSFF